jgi:hypothetical protein
MLSGGTCHDAANNAFYTFVIGPRHQAQGSSSGGSRVAVCFPNGTRVN